ncbi:MAG TPA: GAF domain-containing protein [Terriglobales bacterium]|nr:GAF domain-containing protein [Terriglobales bacterium]
MAAALQPSIARKDSIQESKTDFDSNRTLEEITRSAMHATDAKGAALVLSDGNDMSCRACSGQLAPPVGTRLNPDTGFTATCLRTGEVVRCDDTATDPRINGSGCIELGIRSILAVPVFDGPKVAGVLEVLSGEPKKFGERHVTALKLLARLVETLANYTSRSDGALGTQTSGATLPTTDSAKVTADAAKVMCLSCGHRNPQGSQFCNRCGVILLISLHAEPSLDRGEPGEVDASADEGLKEVYTLISENAGRATWNEIYTRLMGNLQSISAQHQPPVAAKEQPAKRTTTEDTVTGLGRARGAAELKTRLGAAVRRSLWL